MNALVLTLLLAASDPHADCLDTPAEALCRERKQAYDGDDIPGMRALIEREVAAVRASFDGPVTIGALQPLCLPLEAGFNVCNEGRSEDDCAQTYLDQYAANGCLEDPAQRPRYDNMHAMYWHRRMDHGRALEHLQRAESTAWALWLTQWDEAVRTRALVSIVVSMSLRAQIAASLRNVDELRGNLRAIELLRARLAAPGLTGLVAGTFNGLGWSLLMAREAGLTTEDPTPLLLTALDGRMHTRPDRQKADDVRINLALAALQRGDYRAVQRWSEEIDAGALNDEGRMWLRLVQIRAEIGASEPRATVDWQVELDAIAARGHVAMAPWFAAWARGLRMEAVGRPGAAIAAYEVAEAELESYAHSDAEPGTLADRLNLSFSEPTRHLVRLLIETGDLDRAVWVARNSRSRALRAAARADCAEAEVVHDGRPAAEELRLIYFRVSPRNDETATTRWAGFAVTQRDIHVEYIDVQPVPIDLHEYSDADLQRWSDALLDPFADEIASATAIELLATDALHAVPFHALPWDGKQLIDHATVRHGLDLATCGADRERLGAALVVSGDDPRLVAEAEAVVHVIRAGGRPAELLLPRDPSALEPVLAGSHTTLHLAAHGERPWSSELFASDDRLLLTDTLTLAREAILAVPRAPALVFLSACQASFTDTETLGGGVGLAHAFLLRGSRFVVGPVDDINGEVARRFATHFYRELANGELADVPTAWRAAYLSTQAALPSDLHPDLRMLRLHAR